LGFIFILAGFVPQPRRVVGDVAFHHQFHLLHIKESLAYTGHQLEDIGVDIKGLQIMTGLQHSINIAVRRHEADHDLLVAGDEAHQIELRVQDLQHLKITVCHSSGRLSL